MNEQNDTIEKLKESDDQYYEKVKATQIQNDQYLQAILENNLDVLDSVEDMLSKLEEINTSLSNNKDRLDTIDESINKTEAEFYILNNKLFKEKIITKEIINLLENYYNNLNNKINILEKNIINNFNDKEKYEILYSELIHSTASLKASIEENSLKNGLLAAVDNAFSSKIKDLQNILEENKNKNLNIKNYINYILEKNNKILEEKIENKFDKINKELAEIKSLLNKDTANDLNSYSYLNARISEIEEAFEKIVLFLGNG